MKTMQTAMLCRLSVLACMCLCVLQQVSCDVFLDSPSANQLLARRRRANNPFEEMRPGNMERECVEEKCNREEAREIFEDEEKTKEFWNKYYDGDACESNPCAHGGVCKDGIGWYTCFCPAAYRGYNCEIDNTLLRDYNMLKSNYDNLTLENTWLKNLNTNLTWERDELATSNANLTREKDQLQREVSQLRTQIADKSCPFGWKPFGCSCYYRTTGLKTWQQSREECQSQGADLVVINSNEEQEFIRGLATGGNMSWIGLTRTAGRWTWVNVTPLTAQYWSRGYPVKGEDRNCGVYSHRTGKWSNWPCSTGYALICEK